MGNQMFCFQCEQTTGCKACTGSSSACGKKADTADSSQQMVIGGRGSPYHLFCLTRFNIWTSLH